MILPALCLIIPAFISPFEVYPPTFFRILKIYTILMNLASFISFTLSIYDYINEGYKMYLYKRNEQIVTEPKVLGVHQALGYTVRTLHYATITYVFSGVNTYEWVTATILFSATTSLDFARNKHHEDSSFIYKLDHLPQDLAAEWGDMEAFLWKGRLRIIAVGEKCFIRLEDGNTGELFAQCLYDPDTNSVEAVRDSSRYFVLRIENNDGPFRPPLRSIGATANLLYGRRAFIGIGFQERSEAFDFQVTLQDHIKHLKAEKEATEHAKVASLAPKKDYSLKEGQTISINLGHYKSRHSRPQSIDHIPISEETGAIPLLPPPPSVTSIKQRNYKGSTLPSVTTSSNDFGEFKGFEDSLGKINIVNNEDSIIEDSLLENDDKILV
ncbi:10498_t:CDS:2 [Scutellospora calospora]|uniref:10498_t:CDS:1 n=1 Tax=Scutellospora calospora TaxID=85575 RepID=A0ACA9K1K3_9GLOM|nr:10498_t:CDS:2 [Scutellospora calospora]